MNNSIAARLHARTVAYFFRAAKTTRGAGTLGVIGLAFASILASTAALAATFTPGNVVVYRVGDGTAALSSAATAVFLDEYSTSGALVQSVPLPTAISVSNRRCTASGTATSEGLLTLSANSLYLIGACYDAAIATPGITTSSSATINRVIFRADGSGSLDTSTALTDFATASSPRGAASTDGSALWFSGGAGGVRYATLGSTTSTQLSTTTTNIRATEIFNGQLYVSAASGSTRVASVGSGLPTTSGQTITNLPGIPTGASSSPYFFVLLDLDAGVAGVDTLYVADDTTTGGITKYSLVSGSWTSNGVIGNTSGYRGLTASVSGTTVTLYAAGVTGTNLNKLVTVTDTAGYNAAPSTTTVTAIVTAPTNTAFRGVALAPGIPSTPPTGIGNANPNTLNIGDTALLTVAVTQGSPASAITSVTVDLSAFGGSATQTLYDDGTHGDAAAGNGIYSLNFTVPSGTTGGGKTVTATIKDAASRTGTATINFTVNAPTAITATGAANPPTTGVGSNVLLTVTVTPGTNPTSSALIVTADLSSIGGSNNQNFYDDGSNGDVTVGDNTFSYLASIPANNGFAGAKTITANISDAQLRTATATITLTVGASLSIMEIQGHGSRSSYAGSGSALGTTYVSTPSSGHTNVVTAVGAKGFFMQDIAGDGDLTTSDGIFVFTSTAPTVAVGDYVSVNGRLQEFSGSSEIAGTPTVTTLSSGHPLPAPYDLSASLPTTSSSTGICMGAGSTINPATDGYQASNFACLDGMYVSMSNGIVAAPGNGSGGDGIKADSIPKGFYATAGNPRGFREPGLPFDDTHIGGPTTGTGNPTYSGPVFDGNPEEFQVFMTGLNASFPYTSYLYNAGQHFSLTGVIQGFVASGSTTITYETYPITLTTGAAPTYPVPVATSAAGKLTVGSQNGLHFFNNTADGADTTQYTDSCAGTGASDTCPTLAQYQARLNKMSLQIRTVLKAPVVQVMQEVENRSVALDLANKINADDASITYTPYLMQGNDPGGINLAILVRAGVTVNSVTQIYKGYTTTACSGTPPCLLNDRPSVLLDATYQGYHFRVLAIYDRSLLNLGVAGKDYVGQKRREQAEQVASIVQALQTNGATLAGAGNAQQASDGTVTTGSFDLTGDATVPVVVIGDFNAYEFTDGYVDATGTIMGTVNTSQSYSIYPPTASYVAPSPVLFDTGTAANPADHYSYTFNGYAQEIDHILLTQRGQLDFVAVSNAHGNSDVSGSSPDVTDGTTARRVSDHDGQVVTLAYVVTPSADANSAINAATVQTVSKNAQPSFTITPNPGYTATVGGSCGTSGQSSGTSAFTYTINAVTTDCTVVVTSALTAVDGACGADNGATFNTLTANDPNLCSVGPVANFSGNGPWSWQCNASGGGNTASCSAQITTFTLTYNAGSNGTVNGGATVTQSVAYGGSGAPVTAAANVGYHFTFWSGDFSSNNPRTDSNVTSDLTFTANFYIDSYTVNATVSGSGGTIQAPTSHAGVNYNTTTSFTAVPDPGFQIASVSGCGAGFSGTAITTGAITGNCTVTVAFLSNGVCGSDNGQSNLLATPTTNRCSAGTASAVSGSGHPWTWTCTGINAGSTSASCSGSIQAWTVSTTGSGAGGTISAPASSTVDNGSSTTFTVTANSGYSIAGVSGNICAPSLQSGSTYTTGAITNNCTITATFSANPVNGTCGSDDGKTLLIAPTNLCSAGNQSVVNGSGHPWTWTCNGANGGGNAACSATIQTWTVSTTGSGAGGTISVPASSTVDNGSSTTFTVTANSGYSIASVTGDTCTPSVQSGSTYTTGAVTANCAVTATFSANPVNGTCGSDNGQTLLATPTNLCTAGTASVVSGAGHPWSWSCTGANGGTTASCSATVQTWTVSSAVSGSGGTVAPASRTVDNGKTTTFTASPSPGYSLASVSGCGASASSNAITTGAISANCTVTATFSANPINGVCGSDNGKILSSTPVNLCSAGNPSAVSGTGPWTWTCQGVNSGTTASCSAALAPVVAGSIHVIGTGGSAINNGSTTPSVSNGTDLGTTPVGTPLSHSYSISNPALAPGSIGPMSVGTIATFGAAGGKAIIQATGDLVISSITSSNPAFTVSGGTGTIPAGGTATFTVTFNAAVAGPQTATITIVSNDPSAPVFTFVVGAAAAAIVIAPAVPAPALDARMLALLAALMGGIGYFAMRRRALKK